MCLDRLVLASHEEHRAFCGGGGAQSHSQVGPVTRTQHRSLRLMTCTQLVAQNPTPPLPFLFFFYRDLELGVVAQDLIPKILTWDWNQRLGLGLRFSTWYQRLRLKFRT